MGPITAVLPLVLAAVIPTRGLPHGPPPMQRGSWDGLHVRAVRPDPVRTFGLDALARSLEGGPVPACLAGLCSAAAALPGGLVAAGPPAGRRGELLLALLARSPIEPLAGIAARVAESHLRLDYAPARAGGETRGWGQVVVSFRLRLDATGPTAEALPRGSP